MLVSSTASAVGGPSPRIGRVATVVAAPPESGAFSTRIVVSVVSDQYTFAESTAIVAPG
jgi:hypothetical protein